MNSYRRKQSFFALLFSWQRSIKHTDSVYAEICEEEGRNKIAEVINRVNKSLQITIQISSGGNCQSPQKVSSKLRGF